MSTNSWEEVARRSLDDTERRRIDRAPLRSPRAVRLATAAIAAGAVSTTMFLAAGATTKEEISLGLLAGAVASAAVLLGGRYVVTSDRRARALDAGAGLLDERELALQLAARAAAYRWATIIVMLLALAARILLGVATRDGEVRAANDLSIQSAIYALLVFGFAVMPALPQVLHLLRPPDPVDDENAPRRGR